VGTKYKRIGVIRDPELDRALAETHGLLDDGETRSAATQVRALALRGARTLEEQNRSELSEAQRVLRDKYGARPATGDLLEDLPPLGEVDPDDPTPMTDALNWVRGKDRDY